MKQILFFSLLFINCLTHFSYSQKIEKTDFNLIEKTKSFPFKNEFNIIDISEKYNSSLKRILSEIQKLDTTIQLDFDLIKYEIANLCECKCEINTLIFKQGISYYLVTLNSNLDLLEIYKIANLNPALHDLKNKTYTYSDIILKKPSCNEFVITEMYIKRKEKSDKLIEKNYSEKNVLINEMGKIVVNQQD
jgi:hypothetical protein